MFEPIKGKHLYHTGSGNNYMLNPQCEVIRAQSVYQLIHVQLVLLN